MKFAYFVRPHLGGTYSVFTHLREGLAPYGVHVQWVGLGRPLAGGEIDDDVLMRGFYVFPDGRLHERDQAAALIETLEEEGFDGVFINVLAEQMQMNIARFLPERMLRIMIVHNITPGTYAAARAIRTNVHATVAVSERVRNDLIARHGFSPQWTRAIANATDVGAMAGVARSPSPGKGLRLLFLGRIDDISKGVFWLPDILNGLSPHTSLTVAGDGPDLPRLAKQLARFGPRVTLLGAVPREGIARLLADHDVLVMPSRFEGFGLTLIEAMAAGCVPVASRLAGVTDGIVEHGVTGLLFPVGDWRQATRHLVELERQPELLAVLSRVARRRAAARYDVDTMAAAYSRLIDEVRLKVPAIANPLPLEAWSVPAGFRPGLRTWLPRPVKNWLRVARERL